VKHMRDALMHFDEWSRGKGYGPQKERHQAGEALRDVTRAYWGFVYDPTAGTVSLGPYCIHVDTADRAAVELSRAIYLAAHEVDKKNTAELRARTIGALTNTGICCDAPDTVLKVSPGNDLRIWLSLNVEPVAEEYERKELATRIVVSLASAVLRLVCSAEPQNEDVADRLVRGEALYVEPGTKADIGGPDETGGRLGI
ncbi:MAG: hypothetical protein ACRD1G_09175, partial [Acidimicrobiales bacterium]